jgi:pectin methylesterase-like acyl-CoA thioesterase
MKSPPPAFTTMGRNARPARRPSSVVFKILVALLPCLPLSVPAACPQKAAACDLTRGALWLTDTAPAHLLSAATTSAAVHGATSYFVQARVRPVIGAGQGVVLARYSDPDNWLGLRVGIRPGSLRLDVDLLRMDKGQLKRVRQGDVDLDAPDSFYTIRIDVAPGKVTSYVNGNVVHSADAAPAPTPHVGVLAQAGTVAFEDLRLGSAQNAPARLALAGRSNRFTLQAQEAPRRYLVRALVPAGAPAPRLVARSSAPDVAQAAIDGDALVLTALRAGTASIIVADRDDSSVAMTIGTRIEPSFAGTDAGAEPVLAGVATPAPGDTEVPPDTLLELRFSHVPVLAGAGTVRIHRASDHALVDLIGVRDEVNTIGVAADGQRRVVRYAPVQVKGSTLTIRPHDGRLDYDTAYYVLLDGALLGQTPQAGRPDRASVGGKPFAGIGNAATWHFRTRARAPAAGAGTLQVGSGRQADFRTVQGALNHVMRHLSRAAPVIIEVADGQYDDLLYLRGKDNVTLRGQSRTGTVIASRNGNGLNPGAGGSQAANAPGISGGRSVFLVEDADLLHLDRLTLANTMERADVLGGQAEAIHYASAGGPAGGGRLVVTDSTLVSEQDTVLVRGYAWFYRSLVAGNVDFIWGYSPATLFEESEIRSVGDTAGSGKGGYIVQARVVNRDDPGFVFLNSRITHGPGPAGNDVPPASSYLARPGAATTWDNVAFINCRIDAHIASEGWHGQPRDGRGWYEFNSTGPGGQPLDLSRRTGGQVLPAAQAARYGSRQRVFAGYDHGRGWDPSHLLTATDHSPHVKDVPW